MRFYIENMRWLLVGVFLTLTSSVGQTFFISIFSGEIMLDLNLTDGAWGTRYSIGTTASAFLMLMFGGLVDQYRARTIVPLLFLFTALSCIAIANIHTALMLPIVIFCLRFTGQGMISHLASVTMARWFAANRGKALAFSALGFSFGEATFPSIFVYLLKYFDWRTLWYFAALIPLIWGVVIFRLLGEERTPHSYQEKDYSIGMQGRHWQRGDVIRHGLFWFILPTLTLSGIFITAIFFQQVHLSVIKGWSHGQVVALFPTYTLSVIGSSFIFGAAIDRFGVRRIMPLIPIPMALGFLLLALSNSLVIAAIGFVLLGVMQGGNGVVVTTFWADFYGTRYLGSVKSMGTAFMVLGSALGPIMSGLFIDSGVDFAQQMPYIALYCVFASAFAFFGMQRYR